MVLVAVDDLLFSSKIRATAKAAGVPLAFARTPDDILQQARLAQPALVIFDLNSAKADQLASIAALKREPSLAGIRILGFASHVHTELIAAARQAGADDVLPRSSFAVHLPAILASAGAAGPGQDGGDQRIPK